jgi:hypothetical protein
MKAVHTARLTPLQRDPEALVRVHRRASGERFKPQRFQNARIP